MNRVMPWKATDPRCVTVIRTTEHHWDNVDGRLVRRPLRLTKLITADGEKSYDKAQLFDPTAWQLDGTEDVLELLAYLDPQADACIIRGVLKPAAADRATVYRRYAAKWGDTAMFAPAARQWLMVDAENIPCPPGVDPTDPIMAGGAVRRVLPAEFRSVRAAVQLSSSAGVKPGLRVHLWFWLDRPITDAEAKRWLKASPVDDSIYQPIGLHYTAAPIFVGVDDPCFERLGLLPGYAEVAVPALPDPGRPRAAFSPVGNGHHHHGGAERFAARCLSNLALAPVGRRHKACLSTSCRLFELAHAGLLDPVRVVAQVKGVMLGKGFDGRSGRDLSEIDRILEWAWQQTKPKGLP